MSGLFHVAGPDLSEGVLHAQRKSIDVFPAADELDVVAVPVGPYGPLGSQADLATDPVPGSPTTLAATACGLRTSPNRSKLAEYRRVGTDGEARDQGEVEPIAIGFCTALAEVSEPQS